MKITITNTYEELSTLAATMLFDAIQQKQDLHCCLATGASPLGMYKHFTYLVKHKNLNINQVLWTKLDEWVGLPLDNTSTCESFLKTHFLEPLNIPSKQFLSFQANPNNLQQECDMMHNKLCAHPLDICILGLGRNGHLGLNEPGEYLIPNAHVVQLDTLSRTHDMLDHQEVSQGVSLGLYEILNAKKIIFLVNGISKKEVYQKLMKKEISTSLPASFLWLHGNVEMIVMRDVVK